MMLLMMTMMIVMVLMAILAVAGLTMMMMMMMAITFEITYMYGVHTLLSSSNPCLSMTISSFSWPEVKLSLSTIFKAFLVLAYFLPKAVQQIQTLVSSVHQNVCRSRCLISRLDLTLSLLCHLQKLIFHDFPGPTIKFHDFPGSFKWPVRTLNCTQPVLAERKEESDFPSISPTPLHLRSINPFGFH